MNCVVCNKEIEKSRYSNDVLCSGECFLTHFWNEKVEMKDNPNVVRADGMHYYIGSEHDKGDRGFSGRRFKIKFNDGREVITTNLWHNGEIPLRFRELLPDNAVFVEPEFTINYDGNIINKGE